jgi:hypothetical protein
VLGLRFSMEQYHFQMQELKLRCVALFRRTIADFQEQFDIRTLNQEVIEAQSANVGIHTNLAEPGIHQLSVIQCTIHKNFFYKSSSINYVTLKLRFAEPPLPIYAVFTHRKCYIINVRCLIVKFFL